MMDKDRDARDQRLSAWLDGELDKEGADDMSALVSGDESLAARAERFGRIDALVRAAVPEEEVPAELLDRLGLGAPPAGAPDERVIDLAAIRAARTAPPVAGRPARPAAGGVVGGMVWRVAAQVLVIGGIGLGAMLMMLPQHRPAEPAADYRTLSNAARPVVPGAPQVNAVIVFAEGTDPTAAAVIAERAGVRLVGRPNEAGAWKASVAPGRRTSALAALRATPQVTMAEAVDGAAP